MPSRVEFTPEARAEFLEALEWYSIRSAGAALGFTTEVDVALEKIANDPHRFSQTFADCQNCSLKRYPYSIVFYHTGNDVFIVAVAHAKRRPGYWTKRL